MKYHFNFAGKALFKCNHSTVIFSRMKRHDDTGTADKTSIQAYEPISFSPEDFELYNSNTLSKNQCNLKEKVR